MKMQLDLKLVKIIVELMKEKQLIKKDDHLKSFLEKWDKENNLIVRLFSSLIENG
jgi:hypothetical protein